MRALWAILLAAASYGAVIDRVAVVVGTHVITETEVLREVRLTAFLNGQPLDVAPEKRKQAAERLVDQELLREEMELGRYPQPTDAEVQDMLAKYRQEHFRSDSEYRAALAKYGIAENDVKDHLRRQLALMRFTDARFQPGIPRLPEQNTANRMKAGAEPPATDGNSVDAQMDAFLKEARSNTRIQFKPEAFQ
jgi:hypothetical protein